jgi:hypothetical protein
MEEAEQKRIEQKYTRNASLKRNLDFMKNGWKKLYLKRLL